MTSTKVKTRHILKAYDTKSIRMRKDDDALQAAYSYIVKHYSGGFAAFVRDKMIEHHVRASQ